MKAIFIFILFLLAGYIFTGFPALAQKAGSGQAKKVYVIADQMPIFPGGQEALEIYFLDSLAASHISFERNFSAGLTMIISQSGQPQDIELVHGISPAVDKVLLRIARNMPNWQPGILNNKTVNARKIVSVLFPISGLPETAEERNRIFTVTDKEPEFPGGRMALMDSLRRHIDFPKAMERKQIKGEVTVQFVIQKNGRIKDPKIVKGLSPALDAEVMRALPLMPAWKPAKNKDRPVNFSQELTIHIDLPKQKNKPPKPDKIKFY